MDIRSATEEVVKAYEIHVSDEDFESRMVARHDLNTAIQYLPDDSLEIFRRYYVCGDRRYLRKKIGEAQGLLSGILGNGIMP